MKQYYIYLLTNKYNTVFYTGVTNDLVRRTFEHREKLVDGFTKKYNICKLVYYEIYSDPQTAITREKTIKKSIAKQKDYVNKKYESNL